MLAAAFSEFIDPNPAPGNQFGHSVVPLSTGNVVITSPFDDAGGPDAGAVYLFNGATGELISTLTGSSQNDNVGLDGVTPLATGNYVVSSTSWDNGAAADAGAVTFGDGTTGISGAVSADNSLVGTTTFDFVGSNGVIALSNGNYVVSSPGWDNGSVVNAGAVTFGDGTTGISGAVSASNSLVGLLAQTDLQPIVLDDVNQHYFGRFVAEDEGRVRIGSQIDGPSAILSITATDATKAEGDGGKSAFHIHRDPDRQHLGSQFRDVCRGRFGNERRPTRRTSEGRYRPEQSALRWARLAK